MSGGGGSVPVVPGASLNFGSLSENVKRNMEQRAAKTNEFLLGAGIQAGYCGWLCSGINKSIGGRVHGNSELEPLGVAQG